MYYSTVVCEHFTEGFDETVCKSTSIWTSDNYMITGYDINLENVGDVFVWKLYRVSPTPKTLLDSAKCYGSGVSTGASQVQLGSTLPQVLEYTIELASRIQKTSCNAYIMCCSTPGP